MDFSAHKTSTANSPKPFDGIAMFEVTSIEKFPAAFKDPYFVSVVDPDEYNLIDKTGFQGGLIASYIGNMVSILDHNQTQLGKEAEAYTKEWEDFEAKEKAKRD
jgi:hypothetical protein